MSDVDTLHDLLQDQVICMFTTRTADGGLRTIPMARQELTEATTSLWFITARDTEHTQEVEADPRVHVTFSGSDAWLALDAHAHVVDDDEKLKELWTAAAEAWLPEGPESDRAVLLRVDVERAEYWDTPGGRVATALSFVKSKLTGEPYESGHGTVEP